MLVRLTREIRETKVLNDQDGQNSPRTREDSSRNKPKGPLKNKYLPITQAGFQKGRSTRDNSYTLRTLINLAVELGKSL